MAFWCVQKVVLETSCLVKVATLSRLGFVKVAF